MERIEFEKDLIAILLVVESVHDRNTLIYKYEQANQHKQQDESNSFHSNYAIVIAKDFEQPSMRDDDAPRTTFRYLDEKTLSNLTTPNRVSDHVETQVDDHVEIQVDDVVFVGHTLGLDSNPNLRTFAIFFVLRTNAKASIILSYQEMSKRIGTAIRCEEQRTSYLNQEYAKLLGILQQHDIPQNDRLNHMSPEDKARACEERDRTRETMYSAMLEKSPLAATLKQIYLDLQISGEINITINNWLTVSCCLPHRSIALNCSLDIDFAFNVLSKAEQYLKPYYGLLLVIDLATLLASLPTDSSSTLTTLVRHLRSSYSMSRLSMETGVPLSQIYRLASHLLFWGRAKIIYPVHEDNIYIISPNADISKQGSLSQLYKEHFQNTSSNSTLQEALAEYSDAVAFYDHLSRYDNDDHVRDCYKNVEWLLQHRLIVQVHYYYYLVLPDDERSDFKEEYKQTRVPRARPQLRRNQSTETFGTSISVNERFSLTSENIDIRGNVSSLNGIENNMASTPATNALSYMSTLNSRSTETLRTLAGSTQDEVFVSTSINSSTTPTTNRINSYHLALIEQALPNEQSSYHRLFAAAVKDIKDQHITEFLRIIKYLNGTYHLEEIALLENMTRLQVSTLIEKFQSIVIRALHPDPNPILQI